jgi:hypothetical protein
MAKNAKKSMTPVSVNELIAALNRKTIAGKAQRQFTPGKPKHHAACVSCGEIIRTKVAGFEIGLDLRRSPSALVHLMPFHDPSLGNLRKVGVDTEEHMVACEEGSYQRRSSCAITGNNPIHWFKVIGDINQILTAAEVVYPFQSVAAKQVAANMRSLLTAIELLPQTKTQKLVAMFNGVKPVPVRVKSQVNKTELKTMLNKLRSVKGNQLSLIGKGVDIDLADFMMQQGTVGCSRRLTQVSACKQIPYFFASGIALYGDDFIDAAAIITGIKGNFSAVGACKHLLTEADRIKVNNNQMNQLVSVLNTAVPYTMSCSAKTTQLKAMLTNLMTALVSPAKLKRRI